MAAEQIGPARTNLDSFLRGDDHKVNLSQNIQARKALEAQERIQLLSARVQVKQIQINTALQTIQLANNSKAEVVVVREDVIGRANDLLLAALDDAFYALTEAEEAAV
jgi:hypothetical protein